MTFRGLTGSFNWAIELPHTLGAKLTNASPGIVFATIGLILGIVCLRQKPVAFHSVGASITVEPLDAGVNKRHVLVTIVISAILIALGVAFAVVLKK